jgi:small lipoprotein (TIGR04452 family)
MQAQKLTLIGFYMALTFSSCTNYGLLGQGGVKGSKVKSVLNSIALWNNLTFQPSNTLSVTILIDNVSVPGLAGISDSEHYTPESFSTCKYRMSSIGYVLGNRAAILTCSLKTVPKIIQIENKGI